MENLKIGEDLLKLYLVVRAMRESTSYAKLLENWKSFGRDLGVNDATIETLSYKLGTGTVQLNDIPHELLSSWMADEGDRATLKALLDCLSRCRVNHIAELLEEKFWLVAIKSLRIVLHDKVVNLKDALNESTSEETYRCIYNLIKKNDYNQPIQLIKPEVAANVEAKYYIPRSLSYKNEIDERIFKAESTNNHYFLVKGVKKHELAELSGYQSVDVSGNSFDKAIRFRILERNEHWDKILKETSDPVHLIEYEDGHYFWANSNFAIETIYNFVKETKKVYTERELVGKILNSPSVQAFCISDSPGMGKTFLLQSLASEFRNCKSSIVMFIILHELLERPQSINCPSTALNAIIEYGSACDVNKLILEAIRKDTESRIDLFLDGYDELKPVKLKKADNLIKHLKDQKNVRVFVTTRPHLRCRIESILKTISYEIPPFNENDQVQFLSKYWIDKYGAWKGHKIENYARKCLKTLHQQMTNDEREIAGIPLQCWMLAEVFANTAVDASYSDLESTETINITSLFDMYKQIIELKFAGLPQGSRSILSLIISWFKGSSKTNYVNAHVYDSIKLLFPELIEKFAKLLKGFQQINEEVLFSIGLIEKRPYSNSRLFVHRTFAEYLFAEFLVKTLCQQRESVQILFGSIFGGDGVLVKKRNDCPTKYRFKHSTIAYFVNMHLKVYLTIFPIRELGCKISSFLDCLSFKNVCQAMVACGSQNFEIGFDLTKEICQFYLYGSTSLLELFRHRGFKYLPHVAVANSDSVTLVRKVLDFTREKFVVDISKYHVYKSKNKTVYPWISGCTPLHLAVFYGKYNIVAYLVQEYGERIIKFDRLLHMGSYNSYINAESIVDNKCSIIKLLVNISKKHNLSWINEEICGRSPLLEKNIHLRLIKLLVELGANINASSKYGTILHTSCDIDKYLDLVRWVLSKGFKKINYNDLEGKSPLMKALLRSEAIDAETLDVFHQAGFNFHSEDSAGNSVLFHALSNHATSVSCLNKILEYGVKVNHQNLKNRNAAHALLNVAVIKDPQGTVQKLKLLFAKGFNLFHCADSEGITPFDMVIKNALIPPFEPIYYMPRTLSIVRKTKEKVCLSEDELINGIVNGVADPVCGITDSPGMGKTFLLQSLASKVKAANNPVVIFIQLQDLQNVPLEINSFSSGLTLIAEYACNSHGAKEVFKYLIQAAMIEEARIIYLFLDGYDEITQDNLTVADTFLQIMMEHQKLRLFVTTRPHFRSRLENVLKVTSHDIMPFNVSNQVEFLTKHWVDKHGATHGDKLNTFTHECLKTLGQQMTDTEMQIAGIPLYCRMIAQVFAKNAEMVSKLENGPVQTIKITSLFDMYKRFVDMKFEKMSEYILDSNFNSNNGNMYTEQTYINEHFLRSISLLIPHWRHKFQNLTLENEVDENMLHSIGLIENSPTPRFIHRTFAEYLFAEFVVKNMARENKCVEMMFAVFLRESGIQATTSPTDGPGYLMQHSPIVYFLNMHLKDALMHTSINELVMNATYYNVIEIESLCKSIAACAVHGFEACFDLFIEIFDCKYEHSADDCIYIRDTYFKNLPHLIAKSSSSANIITKVLDFTRYKFKVGFNHHIFETDGVSTNYPWTAGCSPLHVALYYGNYATFSHLLEEFGDQMQGLEGFKDEFITSEIKSVFEKKFTFSQILLAPAKADQDNAKFHNNKIDAKLLQILLKFDNDVNTCAKHGNSLHLCKSENNYWDLLSCETLIGVNCSAKSDYNGRDLLLNVVRRKEVIFDHETLELFRKAGANLNIVDKVGDSVLFYVLKYRSYSYKTADVIRAIINYGANVNHRNFNNRNAAHVLLSNDPSSILDSRSTLEIFNLLITNGFNLLHDADSDGVTPFELLIAIDHFPQFDSCNYIPSVLSSIEVDAKIFSECPRSNLLLVKGIKKKFWQNLSGSGSLELSDNQLPEMETNVTVLECDEDFEKSCREKHHSIHLLEYKNGSFFWIKSNKSIKDIVHFLKNKQLTENDLIKEFEKLVLSSLSRTCIISGSSGSGKTLLLTKLASHFKAINNSLVLFINLPDFVQQMAYLLTSSSSALKALATYVSRNKSFTVITKSVFLDERNKIYLFLDAYDEVRPRSFTSVDGFLKQMAELNNFQLFVTTKPHLKAELEKVLNEISYTLLPFSESNRIEFLRQS